MFPDRIMFPMKDASGCQCNLFAIVSILFHGPHPAVALYIICHDDLCNTGFIKKDKVTSVYRLNTFVSRFGRKNHVSVFIGKANAGSLGTCIELVQPEGKLRHVCDLDLNLRGAKFEGAFPRLNQRGHRFSPGDDRQGKACQDDQYLPHFQHMYVTGQGGYHFVAGILNLICLIVALLYRKSMWLGTCR